MLKKTKQILTVLTLACNFGCNCSSNSLSGLSSNNIQVDREYASIILSNGEDRLKMITYDSNPKFGSKCGFVNSFGDTVINFGKYEVFDTVNFQSYAIVKGENGIHGINRNGQIMFDAYLYGDFQLDEFSDGLLRVERNGKIGFINKKGEIVIQCQFECAENFENGQAKVALECNYNSTIMNQVEMKSNNWYFINKKGNKIKTPKHSL
ncbi:WG repeat-containing protein [Crocinitomix catalasitica]|uniref:WG repeat-containing protein n=1 Tax=Crocinitomix catalasitica TaxID=184607 RepID=UPI000683EA7A|nr:WG repeat-containing protein [Crocinitomix catalasitica]